MLSKKFNHEMNTVYKVIFALLHMQMVPPRLKFAQTQMCTKEIH